MRMIAKLLLYSIGNLLPASYQPGGRIAKKIRYQLTRCFIKGIGKNVNIEKGAWFSSDVVIGDNSGIGRNAHISDGVVIGNNVMMGQYCMIYTRNHEFNKEELKYDGYTVHKPVIIHDKVWIGGMVIILPGVEIGEGSTVGAGSVVTKSVPSYVVCAGNPARIIKSLI